MRAALKRFGFKRSTINIQLPGKSLSIAYYRYTLVILVSLPFLPQPIFTMSAPKKSYFDLAREAIIALKERSGSSQQAIKAYITSKYPTLAFGQVNIYCCCGYMLLSLARLYII